MSQTERIILSYILISIILFAIIFVNYYFFRREINVKNNSKAVADGQVVGYAYWQTVKVPIVHFWVDGVRYKQQLTYNAVIRRPGKNIRPREGDALRNYLITEVDMVNPLPMQVYQELFPIGSTLKVYYNPKNPKRSYVERYVGADKFYKKICIFFSIIEVLWTIFMVIVYVNQW